MTYRVPPEIPDTAPATRWTKTILYGSVALLLYYIFSAHPTIYASGRYGEIVRYIGLGLLAGYGIFTFGIFPYAMYKDLKMVRDNTIWQPRWKLYFIATFMPILCIPTGLLYSYKRFMHLGAPTFPGSDQFAYTDEGVQSNWWGIISMSFFADPIVFITFGFTDRTTDLLETDIALIISPLLYAAAITGIVRFFLLPPAFYFDAKAVRTADVDWNPIPYIYAFGGFLIPIIVGPIYLFKRMKTLPESQ